jgi:branched-chain amino acid transport system substrate-binding protein
MLCVLSVGISGCAVPAQLKEITVSPVIERPEVASPAPEAQRGASPEEIAEAARLWERSRAAEDVGDVVRVRRLLRRLVRFNPLTPQCVDARIRLAEDALARGDWSSAHGLVEPLKRDGREGYARHRVDALAYEGQADYQAAATSWLEASKLAEDDEVRKRAIDGSAEDQYLGGDVAGARERAASIGTSDTALRAALESRLDGSVLSKLVKSVPPGDPDRAWLALKSAQLQCAEGELVGCKADAQLAVTSFDAKIVEEARRVLMRVKAWDEVKPSRLGVLLPLSGPFQLHGQAALESIQQALQRAPHVEIVVRDTAGKAGQAATGAEELVLDEHVVAILGPIGEIESRAAVESVGRFRVPHLVLSSHPLVAEDVESALRMRLSASEKVKALARYAVIQLKLKRVAMLVPRQQSRRRQMAAFWDEFVRLGGEVSAAELYPAAQGDFKPVIGKLLGTDKPSTEVVDFDALFIPDDARKVRRMVPFLKYFGVRTKTHPKLKVTKRSPAVQLLGVEAWNSSTVIDGEGLTDNAVFVDTFFHDPDNKAVHGFVRDFYKRHRRKPNAFQAEVFDSVSLVSKAMQGLEGDNHLTRQQLFMALVAIKHHRGVTGHITVLDSGELVLEPRVLTVDAEDIRLRLSEQEEAHLRGRQGGPR